MLNLSTVKIRLKSPHQTHIHTHTLTSGMHIGPEPTTDKFVAVVHGEEGKYIKGNALIAVKDLPFQGLHAFGDGFLNKFEAAIVDAQLLKEVNIIDTPGGRIIYIEKNTYMHIHTYHLLHFL